MTGYDVLDGQRLTGEHLEQFVPEGKVSVKEATLPGMWVELKAASGPFAVRP